MNIEVIARRYRKWVGCSSTLAIALMFGPLPVVIIRGAKLKRKP